MRKPCRMVRSWFWRLPAWQGVTKVYQSQNCGNSRAHSFGSLHTPLASIHLNLEHIMIWMTLWPKETCDMCNICVIITRSQTWQRGTEVLAMFGRHIHHVPTKTSFWNHSLASVTYRSPTSQRSHNVVMTCYDLVYWFNPPLPKPWRRILLCTTSASHEFQVSTPTAKWAKLIYKQQWRHPPRPALAALMRARSVFRWRYQSYGDLKKLMVPRLGRYPLIEKNGLHSDKVLSFSYYPILSHASQVKFLISFPLLILTWSTYHTYYGVGCIH